MTAKITTEQVQELVEEVGYPCPDIEGLKNVLNNFIFDLGTAWEEETPRKNVERKRLRDTTQNLEKDFQEIRDSLLTAYSWLGSNEDYLGHEGLSPENIEASKMALLLLLKRTDKYTELSSASTSSLLSTLDNNPNAGVWPITDLMGKYLPEIYEEYFGKKWKISRSGYTGKPTGPAIRFAEYILKYMNIERSAEAIHAAKKRISKNGTRKK